MNNDMKQIKIDASVIIPSYNQIRYVRSMLDSLNAQQTRFHFEVIVVDSGTDETEQIIKANYPWVRLIKMPQRTYPGQARNIGVGVSQGDVILFTDTDCRVSQDWIECFIADQNKDKKIVTGPVMNGTPHHVVGTLDYLLECYDTLQHTDGTKQGPIGTANVSYHRSILEKYGPLDGFVKGSDSRFSRKLLTGGEVIYYNRHARVWHSNRTNLVKVFKNQYLLGLGAARTNRMFETKGNILIQYPFLTFFMPFYRSVRIGLILLLNNPAAFLPFVLLFPCIFIGLCFHAFGFIRGTMNGECESISTDSLSA
jgi:glycosyltransferase involved in cell wall biosynthesis